MDKGGRSLQIGRLGRHPRPARIRLPHRRRRLRRQRAGRAARARAERAGAAHRPTRPHRRQRVRSPRRRRPDPSLRAAHLPHQLGRDRRLPVALHRLASVRAPGARERGGSSCRCRSTATRSNAVRAAADRGVELAKFYADRRRADRPHPHGEDVVVTKVGRELYNKFFRGYTRKRGADPSELDVGTGPRGPTPTTATSPTPTRPCPRTASRRCSGGCSTTPSSRCCSARTSTTWPTCYPGRHPRLHRPDRQLLPLPVRRAPLSQPRVAPRRPPAAGTSAGGVGQLPGRLRLDPGDRVPAPHRSGPRRPRSWSSSRGPRGTRITPCPRRRTRALYASYQAAAEPGDVTFVGRLAPTSTSTWSRSSRRHWPP